MRILSPVDNAAEAARLTDLGAKELYGGYLDRKWEENFGLGASTNRRSFPEAQLQVLKPSTAALRRAYSSPSLRHSACSQSECSRYRRSSAVCPRLAALRSSVSSHHGFNCVPAYLARSRRSG